MLIGVLADIHGNSAALSAVLDDAAARGVSELVVLGDLVGYYYDPAGVLSLLDEWETTFVRGNHEDLLAEWLAGDAGHREELGRRYGSGFAACADTLSAERLAWLTALPHPVRRKVAGTQALYCHGHPRAIDEYVYPDKMSERVRAEHVAGLDLVWLGHTHYQMDAAVAGTRVCNPGSVGQPRDRDPRAAWAIWEPDHHAIEFVRTPYDHQPLVAETRRRDAGVPYMREVLVRTAGQS